MPLSPMYFPECNSRPFLLGVFSLGPAQCIGILMLFFPYLHAIAYPLESALNVQKVLTTIKLGILGFILIGALPKGVN